ncbi:MAG TPA: PilZ domain-containing protein [Candidatus Nitrosotenuis sp.]|jgi:c-di-GMP-binding flagellar brake protein YcgR|nr:PilZ domain-containing protein [Candidatus Nitrosotenuis sp.]
MLESLVEGLKALVQGRGGSSVEDKRRLIRLRCHFKVTCAQERRAFEAAVTDMGLGGMRLKVPERLKPGERVTVTNPAVEGKGLLDSVRCAVVWCRKQRHSEQLEVGVRYDDTPANMARSWVKFVLRNLGFDERAIYQKRKNIRAATSLPCHMELTSGKTEGRVVNLGVGGALVQSDYELPTGGRILLRIGPWQRLPALELGGQVRSGRFVPEGQVWLHGVRFINLSPAQVEVLGRYVITILRESTRKV